MLRPKKVAIVGAGPAGLVAAKTLLHSYPTGTFQPTIFEQKPSIGGLWSVTKESALGGLLDPAMRTNLSRFTVAFSDFAWESVDLGLGDEADGKRFIPMFPTAVQVENYLQAYARRYIPADAIRVGCKVVQTVRERGEWVVEWRNSDSGSGRELFSAPFDFLIVASGYFAKPFIPDIPGLGQFGGRVVHSSALRKADGFLFPLVEPKGQTDAITKGGKLVVIGGSMSGADSAAAIALYLSSSAHSPGFQNLRKKYSVHHVCARPFWSLPTYLPAKLHPGGLSHQHPSSFLPLDLVLYDLGRRPPGQINVSVGAASAERSRAANNHLESLIGSDQSDMGHGGLTIGERDKQSPPWVAVSENYAEFARSGDINVILGRVGSVICPTPEAPGEVDITLPNGEHTKLEDVSGIILATGFVPFDSLSFLSKDILSTLEYSDSDSYLPVILEGHGCIHAGIPSLGFIGWYKGPYWGVMEMQARTLARAWVTDGKLENKSAPPTLGNNTRNAEEMEQLRKLRSVSGYRTQFPMGDYIGLMESLARDVGVPRFKLANYDERGGPVAPARYASPSPTDPASSEEVTTALRSLEILLSPSANNMACIAKATFRALQGTWKLSRTLKSALPTYPAGTFTGTASFHPRYPTDPQYDGEYLYEEEGILHTDQGASLRGTRKYIYRLQESQGARVSAWFVKPDDGKMVDYFFHDLEFAAPDSEKDTSGTLHANGSHHLCAQDHYDSAYEFSFRGVSIQEWQLTYTVTGPKKDYWTRSQYER